MPLPTLEAHPELYDIDSSRYIGTGLGDAPSTGDSMYDKLYGANPYRNLTYRESLWQRIASAFGFRTDADRWREDAQVNSAEYDAMIAQMQQQNDYNDPAAMASRERAAGMNPDLLGIGDVAESAGPQEDPNGMSPNLADEFNSFGESVSTIFARAMTIWKDFKSLDQINAAIDSQNIDNARNMVSTIDEIIEGAFTAEDMESFDSYIAANNRLADSLGDDEALDWKQSIPYSYGFNKRQREQFYQVARTRLKSMLTDKSAFENMKNRLGAMNDAQGVKTSPFYSDSQSEDNAVNVLVTGVRKAQREAMKLNAIANKYRASLEQEEVQALDEMGAARASAGAQVSEFNSRKFVAQWNQACARIKKDMLNQLDLLAKQGDSFSKALLYSWSLDDIARLNVGLNAGLNLSFGANFGANISNSVSTLFKQ